MYKKDSNTNIEFLSGRGFLIHEIYFDNLYELVNYIKKEPIAKYWEGSVLSSESGSKEFTGTKSLDEAVKLCLSPSNEFNRLYLTESKKILEGIQVLTKRRRMENSFYGGSVSIPRYLNGNPKCMRRAKRVAEKRLIKFYINGNYTNRINLDQLLYRGMCIITIIQWFEQLGYMVELNFFNLVINTKKNELLYYKINVKEPGQLLDVRNTYFPFCHTSFLRRIIFAVYERIEFADPEWKQSYGYSVNDSFTQKFLNLDDDSIIIGSNSFDEFVVVDDLKLTIKNFIEQYQLEKYLNIEDAVNLEQMEKVLQKKKNM